MERGLEQLLVIAAIILAGVFEVLVRWVKSLQRKDAPVDASRYDENPVLVDEDADFELPADVELPTDIKLTGEELVERAPPPSRPRRVSRRLLASPLDARRGIIMMTILGPCRGLERPDSEA